LTHESMIMCSFEHNFPLVHPMRRVSTKLYQLRDVRTCKFSLKRRISALFWLTWTPPCATFDMWTCLSGKFPFFCPLRTDYKVMPENSGLTHAKDCDARSLWKDVPLHNFLTYMDVFPENFLIEARVCIQLVAQFPMLTYVFLVSNTT